MRPGDEVEIAIILANDGSAAAHDGVLHLRIDPALDEVRVFEKNARLNLDGPSSGVRHADTLELGAIEPYATRRMTMRARVPYAVRKSQRGPPRCKPSHARARRDGRPRRAVARRLASGLHAQ